MIKKVSTKKFQYWEGTFVAADKNGLYSVYASYSIFLRNDDKFLISTEIPLHAVPELKMRTKFIQSLF